MDAEGDTQVVVFEGAVEVASLTNPDRRVLIEAGRGVLVQGGQDFHLIGANRRRRRESRRGRPQRPAGRGKPMQQANARAGPMVRRPGPGPAPACSRSPSRMPHPHASRRRRAGRMPNTIATIRRAPPPSTYDRYLAGLADIGQVPFLFRFNAFPEAHLDSLENPAYATEFRSAEGRVFILPTFRGARTLQEYQSAFGPGGSLPSDYSISPQISYFAPARRLHVRRQRFAFARRQHHADGDAGL